MDRYIEVTGEGQFTETASRFVAEVVFEVRAAKNETAFAEVGELARTGVAVLREAGLSGEEIVEGGTDLYQPWWAKKQTGQTASRKIILKVADFNRLNAALIHLEPLQSKNKERKTVQVSMHQPEFEAHGLGQAGALAAAFRDAREKAEHLSVTMGCRLGEVTSVEEGNWARRASGFSGDPDWDGDSSRLYSRGLAMMAAPEPEAVLPSPTRTIFVKCRVRFALQAR